MDRQYSGPDRRHRDRLSDRAFFAYDDGPDFPELGPVEAVFLAHHEHYDCQCETCRAFLRSIE